MTVQIAIISTFTSVLINNSNIQIKTEYLEEGLLPDTIEARITENVGIQDQTSFIEGELLIKMKNSPENIFYFIDNNGNLILNCTTGDQDNYSIDSDGNLIYSSNQ